MRNPGELWVFAWANLLLGGVNPFEKELQWVGTSLTEAKGALEFRAKGRFERGKDLWGS